MNDRQLEDLFRDWQRAERVDDPAAEAAFSALFAGLPLESPRAGFAARVIARAELVQPLPLPVPSSTAGRWTAVFLAFASFASLLLARWLLAQWPAGGASSGVNTAVRGGTDLMAELGTWLAGGLAFWQRLADFGSWVSRIIQTPEVAISLLASTLVAAAAFRGLQQLLAHERWAHVEH
jgi:hypothetical protein